jgi:calcium-dependent protein kinase
MLHAGQSDKMGCGSSKRPDASDPSAVPRNKSAGATVEAAPPARTLLEDYEFQETIGVGGFAVTKKCLHKPTGQVRAAKILLKSKLSSHLITEKHKRRELQALRALAHPSILRCFDLLEDDSRFYLITEYCAGGGELYDMILKRTKFTESDAAEIVLQVLSSLVYCHARKVIHRDLKPENIFLVDKQGSFDLKVADFGSSAFLRVQNKVTGAFGSAYYLAPEVVELSYNELCDVWSLGIILYILLTGCPPYPGKDEDEVMNNIRLSPFDINSAPTAGISADALDLLRRMLDPSPATRVSAEEAIRHSWITRNKKSGDSGALVGSLTSLKSFNASNKLKDSVMTFLASQVTSQQDLKQLKASFQTIDKNGDGTLSRAELIEQYSRTFSVEAARAYVDDILNAVDADQSGTIDYTEFIKACSNKERLLSMKNLEYAFRTFDSDGNGTITSYEIKELLGDTDSDDLLWQEVIAELDQNGDGTIDLKEFVALMQRKA